jgi:hypothetical protein
VTKGNDRLFCSTNNKHLFILKSDCSHDWVYLGGHNEFWVCKKCGTKERR